MTPVNEPSNKMDWLCALVSGTGWSRVFVTYLTTALEHHRYEIDLMSHK